MIQLQPIIARIRALLDNDTEASVTYAALEARLALEKVCYDRLRQRHDYISHDQLRKWQPNAVINTLIKQVDADLGQTLTLSVGMSPLEANVRPEDDEYLPVGTEVGFNVKRITKMWNALAKLALHVRLPEHRNDYIPEYGHKSDIRAKVEEVVAELERLATGTMIFSGIGEEVSFSCSCGEKNKRRSELLHDGQHIHCINPECKVTWKATKEQDGFTFETVNIQINCDDCKAANYIPKRYLTEMKLDELGSFACHACSHRNFFQWRIMHVRPVPTLTYEDRAPSAVAE